MRELTSLKDQEQAGRLTAYLAVQSIESTMESDGGEWVIWIHNDDDREKAAGILKEFQQNPEDPRYENAERKVRHVLREAERLEKENLQQVNRQKKRWDGSWWHCFPATYIMMGLCVVVALVCTQWENWTLSSPLCNNQQSELLIKLKAATPIEYRNENGLDVPYYLVPPKLQLDDWDRAVPILQEKLKITLRSLTWTIKNGEIWRPVTPAFIHLNLIHILMNMMAFRSFGMAVEFTRGTGRFIALCIIVAAVSHTAELFWSGPFFGGMSGVIFGLVGYVWMKGKTQPRLGIGLQQQTLVFCLLWLFLCMAGVFGPIANAAHLVGFLTGILIGARQAIWKKISFTA